MTDETLLPCPFCGHTPTWTKGKVYHDQLHGEPLQDDILGCRSSKCSVKPSISTGSKIATQEIWNTRNNDQALTAHTERIVGEIEKKKKFFQQANSGTTEGSFYAKGVLQAFTDIQNLIREDIKNV